MTGPPTENGWYLLFLHNGEKIAGKVRVETTGGLRRLEVDVPRSQKHAGHLAVIAPESVERCVTCQPEEAELMAAALRRDPPVSTSSYDDVPALQPHAGSPPPAGVDALPAPAGAEIP